MMPWWAKMNKYISALIHNLYKSLTMTSTSKVYLRSSLFWRIPYKITRGWMAQRCKKYNLIFLPSSTYWYNLSINKSSCCLSSSDMVSSSTALTHIASGLVPIPCPFVPMRAMREQKPSGVRNWNWKTFLIFTMGANCKCYTSLFLIAIGTIDMWYAKGPLFNKI